MPAVKLVYFAWVREKVGRSDETRDLPEGVTTGAELIHWLCGEGEEYAAAFAQPDTIRIAIDQAHADHATSIAGAREIAFFPPVTGG